MSPETVSPNLFTCVRFLSSPFQLPFLKQAISDVHMVALRLNGLVWASRVSGKTLWLQSLAFT